MLPDGGVSGAANAAANHHIHQQFAKSDCRGIFQASAPLSNLPPLGPLVFLQPYRISSALLGLLLSYCYFVQQFTRYTYAVEI